MNRILGWIQWDAPHIDREKLVGCEFKSPYWQPDHQAIYVENNVGLSATQRFITPECHDCLMPYRDSERGLVINADAYLTNREHLCHLLETNSDYADAKLILLAYQKWGERCTHYLIGQFCFVIWDPRTASLFAATDQFSSSPFFYAHQKGQFFICANEFSPFHQLCSKKTLNAEPFIKFAFEIYSPTETSYKEVLQLAPGQQLHVNSRGLTLKSYWNLRDQKHKIVCKTREEYYGIFQQHFSQAVRACLRSDAPITAHISGGLDSSSVASQAAKLLAQDSKILHGFTAIPRHLEGPSYRNNWYYHELPRVQAVLDQFPNIKHFTYRSIPDADIFFRLKAFYPYMNLPIRNVSNFDWILACYDYMLSQQSRILLIGGVGNGTISWIGNSLRNQLSAFYGALKIWRKPQQFDNNFFNQLNPQLLNSRQGRKLLRQRALDFRPQRNILCPKKTASLRASAYAIELWYGVKRLDPTQDLALMTFCYNLPQWVYYKGKEVLQKRLLVREGLRGIVPDAIADNPHRGEQGADWYLQYNNYRAIWQQQLETIHPKVNEILWQCYDYQKMQELFLKHATIETPPNKEITDAIRYNLMRCLSAGFYLDELMYL